MTSRFSKDIEIYSAKQFKESVSEPQSSNLYFTFGRVTPWANDAEPLQANTGSATIYDVWKNMIGAKRISGNDIRHVIPRHDWTANTVFNAFDNLTDSLDLHNTAFYILTSDWNVYKCLSNNYGRPSTTMPSSTATISNFQTADGYIWKYMYTVNAEERLNYLTDSFMPVKTLVINDGSAQWLVQDSAIDGAIDTILLTNNGIGYTNTNVSIIITGDGIEANAFAQINTSTNTISSIVVDNRGSGYTYANVSIYQANNIGSNASARVIMSPVGGHGRDPLSELGGSFLMLNLKLKSDEGGAFIVNNDYRQISIIEDPYYWLTTIPASNTTFSQLTVVSLNGVSAEYIEDEIVYQGTSLANAAFKGTVAQWDSSNNIMKLTNVEGTPTSELLIGSRSTGARFLDSVIAPDLRPYSGKLLYINNITPIERSIDQTESFKIILKF